MAHLIAIIAAALARARRQTDQAELIEQAYLQAPPYLVTAAKKKYGQNINVTGALPSDIADFWSTVQTKADPISRDNYRRAEEVGRIVVDSTAKEHWNYGAMEDTMEVLTHEEETKNEKRSYALSFGKRSGWQFGGGLNVGASFFNMASAGIGIEGKRTKGKWSSNAKSGEEEHGVSQTYSVTGKIKVPPKTKVTVYITTFAVTYKLKVKVRIVAPISSYIPFKFTRPQNTSCNCCFGRGFAQRNSHRTETNKFIGYLFANELFQDVLGLENHGWSVQFTMDSVLSYITETAEMDKEETPL